MNNIELNSICVKISVLLTVDNNYTYTISDLLYHLAISDFCKDDGTFNSHNIRNINSTLYYSKILNAALLKMQLFNLIIVEGETIRSSSISENFMMYCAYADSMDKSEKMLQLQVSETVSMGTEFRSVDPHLRKDPEKSMSRSRRQTYQIILKGDFYYVIEIKPLPCRTQCGF